MKKGEQQELTTMSLDSFSKFVNELPDDKDAQLIGYLAMIAQHTALIADRMFDLVKKWKGGWHMMIIAKLKMRVKIEEMMEIKSMLIKGINENVVIYDPELIDIFIIPDKSKDEYYAI